MKTTKTKKAETGWDKDLEAEAKKKTIYGSLTKKHQIADKIIEVFRNYRQQPYRTTASGNRVRWDEPTIERENEISDRIQRLQQTQRQLRQARLGRDRLKSKNSVPLKRTKPMWEQMILDEDLNKAITLLRQHYYSPKMMRFRDWCKVMEHLMDELE